MKAVVWSPEDASDLGDLIALRRQLHQIPEVGLELPQTQKAVLDALAGLDVEISTGTATTSVVAVIRGARPGPTVLLRADMDGLPITETTGLPYASTNGAMHACGHDLHTAALVGAARLLVKNRDKLEGDVLLMFQPGEEGYGGAKVMINEGLLEATGNHPVAAYALHVSQGIRGRISTRAGAFLASSNNLRVTLNGPGGHGSEPHKTADPVVAAAEIVLSLQALVTRRLSWSETAVLSVTQIAAGTAINVIPDTLHFGATIRTLSTAALDIIEEEARRTIEHIAAVHHVSADIEFNRIYPVTINDTLEVEALRESAVRLFGADRYDEMMLPAMAAEDFSFVLERVPGMMSFVAASPPGLDPSTLNHGHSPGVLFDDSVLTDMAELLADLAINRLQRAEP